MKKSLLLTIAAILLLAVTQKFDGQEKSQSHRQLPPGGKAVIERQNKMAQAPFVSKQEPDRWTTDHTLPYQHRMTNPMGQRDYKANTTITGKTHAQHELSAGVDTAWVRHYFSGLYPSSDEATAIAVDGSGNVYVTGSSYYFLSGYDYLTVKYDPAGVQLWIARYNGPENYDDQAIALVVDASDNVYVTGNSATVKYNSDGIQQWVKVSGTNALALAVDASGNVYVTGESWDSGTEPDYVTVKYNIEGVEQWVAHYNGPGNGRDSAIALAVDASGNIYVTGESGGDYATIKYNSAGIEQWVARYDGPGNDLDWATALAVDASGNVYVTGASADSIEWVMSPSYDYATVKYNSAGVEQWVARFGSPGEFFSDRATALAMDASGNVYVTGESQGSGRECDFATVKYNSAGVEQWVARYNGPGNSDDVVTALAVDAAGNIIVTGRSNSGSYPDQNPDYTTIKYNSAGAEQWVTRYNGTENKWDNAIALTIDAVGNVYVTGNSHNSGTGSDYATLKYNSEGVQQWVACYDGAGTGCDEASALVLDAAGNIYVTGESWLSGTGSDYATVKYNSDGVQQWVTRYNGPGNTWDRASALAVDASGNIYVTGKSLVSGTERSYYATVKYNSDGIQQWVNRYNGPGNDFDEANALAVDASGNVYVTGTSVGSGTKGDFATVKYNAAGAEQWVARYNGPGNGWDWANALAVDASGNIYVAGESYGSDALSDYATVKYNSDGVQQWVARYNGPGNFMDGATALAMDASGNIYVTGISGGSGTNYDYATVKYNSAGAEQWVARYDGPRNLSDEAIALAVDASGNVNVTGTIVGSGTGWDYATVKYNSAGVEQWVVHYNGPENYDDQASALTVDASGNVYVTGSSCVSDIYYDYATVKYNSAGAEQWVARYNGPGNYYDRATALAVVGSGNVYVTGSSTANSGWSVYTTIKYVQTPVSVEKGEPGRPSSYWLAQNYPNPFNPSTTIEFALPKSAFVTLKIYNLLGEEIATLIEEKRSAGIYQFNWDASGLASGVYFYRLEAGSFRQSKKLILMR